jgi:hypothetical protein
MKKPRRSAAPRRSSKRVAKPSPSKEVARIIPPTATQATAGRIADKMQRLALRRPHMLHLVEHLLDGMLGNRRGGDDPER